MKRFGPDDALPQDLRKLHELLREDLSSLFHKQEIKMRELLKVPGQQRPYADVHDRNFSSDNLPPSSFGSEAADDLPEEMLPEGSKLPPRPTSTAKQMPTESGTAGTWAVRADSSRLLGVMPDHGSGYTGDPQEALVPGTVQDGGEGKPPGKSTEHGRRLSVRKTAKEQEEDPALKEIRMKNGFMGGPHDKETRLDEELYNVTNFYKTTGCSQAIARSEKFERITLLVISINAVYIGVDAEFNPAETMLDENAVWPFQVCDNLFCTFFTFELLIRFSAFALKRNCLRDKWFVFDTLLVLLMIAETWVLTIIIAVMGASTSMPTGPLRLLRLLRLSRLVRLIRSAPELLTLINGMRVASRAVSSALLLIGLITYVFAIVLLMFLKPVAENDDRIAEAFGTLGFCIWTLILDGTFMDGTKDIVNDLRTLPDRTEEHWMLGWAMILIFFAYVLLTNVTVMNMLIGILCEVVSEVKRGDEEGLAIDFMKGHLRSMLTELDKDGNENISKMELAAVVEDEKAQKVLSELQVKPEDVIDLTEYLFEQDQDAGREQEVTREELLEVILKIRGGREISNQDIIDVRCDACLQQADIRRIVQRQTGLVLKEMGHLCRRIGRIEDRFWQLGRRCCLSLSSATGACHAEVAALQLR
ncbi:para [Symbiodinium necroappetens]|uniref:Para protein n=1 Tax=Symbiodinium necroappetens TaxID=1628268 RepID=A0A812ZW45_9DINO|nr:para [Symbiodinium necroappetens]